jgi:hypothetical protein
MGLRGSSKKHILLRQLILYTDSAASPDWTQKDAGSILLQVGNHVSAARVLELMQGAGFAPTVQAYTSYMDACIKADTASSLAKAFQVQRLSYLPRGLAGF